MCCHCYFALGDVVFAPISPLSHEPKDVSASSTSLDISVSVRTHLTFTYTGPLQAGKISGSTLVNCHGHLVSNS